MLAVSETAVGIVELAPLLRVSSQELPRMALALALSVRQSFRHDVPIMPDVRRVNGPNTPEFNR